MTSNFKQKRLEDPAYLKAIREKDCVISGMPGPSDPAHIRYGLAGGMGRKPDDNLVVPLSHKLHQIQHNIGEVSFWCKYLPQNPHFLMECVKAYAREQYRKKDDNAGFF